MDDFKVACIFAKVEFVGYVLNTCIAWLQLELSCNMDEVVAFIEHEHNVRIQSSCLSPWVFASFSLGRQLLGKL